MKKITDPNAIPKNQLNTLNTNKEECKYNTVTIQKSKYGKMAHPNSIKNVICEARGIHPYPKRRSGDNLPIINKNSK